MYAMGKRKKNFQFERVRRVEAKQKRDQAKRKRAAKGPGAGARLAAKMHGRTA